MRKSIIILFISLCNIAFGQELSKSGMYHADFDYLIEKLIETHPDPYSGFGGPIEFFRKKIQTSELITNSMTNEEFVILLNQFLSNLNDGHTSIFFPKNENKIRKVLPLKFKVSTDKMFVQNSTEEYAGFKGNQLLGINKIPISELLIRAKAFEPSENVSGEYYSLNRIISNSQLARKLFGTEILEFTFNSNEGKTSSTEVSYREQVNYISEKSKIDFKNDNGLLDWSMIGKNKDIGYMAWNSILSREVVENTYKNSTDWIQDNLNWAFNYLKEKQSGNIENDINKIPSLYEQFYLLTKAMKNKNSKYLILDLRENSGGMTPIVRPLLYILFGDDYLNFDFEAEMIRKISPLYLQKIGFSLIADFNKAYNCNLKVGDYIFDSFGNFDTNSTLEQRKKIIENGYNGFGAEYIKKTEPLTNVQIFVLTSPQTFSAAYHFSYFLKKLGRTRLVGVASRQAGNAFMETTNITLPNTNIRGSISNSKQILFKDNLESGTLFKPDYEMDWNDFKRLGFDKNSEILKTLEIIENEINNAC
ncbi:MAG: S41 family peptidase [Bacteroidales bacterium]